MRKKHQLLTASEIKSSLVDPESEEIRPWREILRLVAKKQRLRDEFREAAACGDDAEVRRLTAEIEDTQMAEWEAMPEGSFWGDVVRMDNPNISDKKRIEATDRLLSDYFSRPIHRARWDAAWRELRRELSQRADSHKVSTEEEFRRHARSALHAVAAEAVGRRTLSEKEEAIQSVQRALNEALTKDILGSDWRRKSQQREFVDEGDKGQEEQSLFDELELNSALKRKGLTKREVEVVLLRREGFSYAEVAARLQATPGALRTAYHRTKRKLAS